MRCFFDFIADRLMAVGQSRLPDFVVGGFEKPYLQRWFLIPRNPIFNIYLHQFLRSDDDRALHDHPWWNCSVLLFGHYLEHKVLPGGIETKKLYKRGAFLLRVFGSHPHRLELIDGSPCWTLFVTGPRYRQWGFHCPKAGWVHWSDFTASDDAGSIGSGCDQ